MLCGIDEAGRGCWAGPVIAAAVVFKDGQIPEGLRDSKVLSAKRREALYPLILEQAYVGVGLATAKEIDEINILQATFLAMRRAIQDLPALALSDIVVDGNRNPLLPDPFGPLVRTLVKADALVAEVSAASIVAKVSRDRLLEQLDAQYPGYGFGAHAGYGVPEHMAALLRQGPCAEHRMSFAPLKRLTAQAG